MDDASGNYFGRQLIRDYFFGKMPEPISIKFNNFFDLDAGDIKDKLYKKPNPNTYLAKFARFLIDNKDEDYSKRLIHKGFNLFIENQIKQFHDCKEVPLHFVGSICFYLKDELIECLNKNKLKCGKVLRRPIDGLVSYHMNSN